MQRAGDALGHVLLARPVRRFDDAVLQVDVQRLQRVGRLTVVVHLGLDE